MAWIVKLEQLRAAILAVVAIDAGNDGETQPMAATASATLRADGLPERLALRYAVRAASSCVADYGVTGSHLIAELEAIRNKTREYQPG